MEDLQLCTLYSGSKGNCTYIRAGGDAILIEPFHQHLAFFADARLHQLRRYCLLEHHQLVEPRELHVLIYLILHARGGRALLR